ncbi:MAG TPA: Spy/CpxP family protein refolding chaperone [Armatimonadota bacterium]|nr:Spy/CpxP family protein refolding chaperone [Armatimonadota bacterium]
MSREQRGTTLLKGVNRSRRRPRFQLLGPWTTLAVAAGVILIWRGGPLNRPPRPVILPPEVITSGAPPARLESVSILLRRAPALNLTSAQDKRIRAIAAAEAAAANPIVNQLKTDRERMDRFVEQARKTGGASLSTVKSAAAPMVADSRQLSAERAMFWDHAMSVLTASQRRKVETPHGPAGNLKK